MKKRKGRNNYRECWIYCVVLQFVDKKKETNMRRKHALLCYVTRMWDMCSGFLLRSFLSRYPSCNFMCPLHSSFYHKHYSHMGCWDEKKSIVRWQLSLFFFFSCVYLSFFVSLPPLLLLSFSVSLYTLDWRALILLFPQMFMAHFFPTLSHFSWQFVYQFPKILLSSR